MYTFYQLFIMEKIRRPRGQVVLGKDGVNWKFQKNKSKKLPFLDHRNVHTRLTDAAPERTGCRVFLPPRIGSGGTGLSEQSASPTYWGRSPVDPLTLKLWSPSFPEYLFGWTTCRMKGFALPRGSAPFVSGRAPTPHACLRPQLPDPPALCTSLSKGR